LVTAATAGLLNAQLGRPAPELRFIAHTGESINLAALKGSVVIVEFLLTHCPACQSCAVVLSRLQSEYASKGVRTLGVAIDQGAGAKLPEFTSRYATTFPVGVKDLVFAHGFLQKPMGTNMLMPQIVFVDRKGIIREQHSADESWFYDKEQNIRSALDKLLAQGASSKKPAARSATKKPG
jgi:peroxiredoxin